ncbi:hypothetical protein CRM22_011156 [Opisthorchis felineus]|uniref:Uncharacterized protein n=1 Tax=Opisthorchis felineus TaxID=147828 RepID=A0A4S2KEJ4_OPIFE|nr:hypothetical protein CRM22_011156 [Opisthorchis felineus]
MVSSSLTTSHTFSWLILYPADPCSRLIHGLKLSVFRMSSRKGLQIEKKLTSFTFVVYSISSVQCFSALISPNTLEAKLGRIPSRALFFEHHLSCMGLYDALLFSVLRPMFGYTGRFVQGSFQSVSLATLVLPFGWNHNDRPVPASKNQPNNVEHSEVIHENINLFVLLNVSFRNGRVHLTVTEVY